MTSTDKKHVKVTHWFKHKNKVKHRTWIAAARQCVRLWFVGRDGFQLGVTTVYSCRMGARWYDEEPVRHYHVGRKGRQKREKELARVRDR